MALTRVSRHIIDEPLELQNINATGIGTFASLRVTGDLQVDGTTTTLDTVVTEVDRLEVSANNSTVGAAITQTGSGDILNLYDGSTEVFSVTDGGKVKIGTETEGDNSADNLTIADSGNSGITIRSGTSNQGSIFFSDATSGSGEYDGFIQYSQNDQWLKFGTATSTRLTITSTGYVGINETAPSNRLHVKETNSNTIVGKIESSVAYSYLSIEDNSTTTGNVRVGAHGNDLVMNAGAVQRLRITSDGKVRVPDSGKFTAGADDDLEIFHNGGQVNESFVDNKTGNLNIRNLADDKDITIQSDNGSGGLANYIFCDGSSGRVVLSHYGSGKIETTSYGAKFSDNVLFDNPDTSGRNLTWEADNDALHWEDNTKATFGGGNDLQIYHDATDSFISNSGPGQLYIKTETDDRDVIIQSDNGSGGLANYVKCDGSTGAVELTHYGNIRIQTTNTGASVTGNLNISGHTYLNDDREVVIGAGQDLKLYHESSSSSNFISASPNLKLLTDTFRLNNAANNNNIIVADSGDGVDLYFNNSKKFETTTTGAKVTGALEVTQEYPSIRPTLDLNFAATKTLDRRITFTRNTIGTYTDENGLVKYASNNVPRFDHNFGTGESLGLLIEESRTNRLPNSEDFSSFNPNYSSARSTIASTTELAPDGTNTATKLVRTSGQGTGEVALLISGISGVTSGNTYTSSLFVKHLSGSNSSVVSFNNVDSSSGESDSEFNLLTGAIVTEGNQHTTSIIPYANGWYRIILSNRTASTNGAYFWIRSYNQQEGSGGFLLWGAQVEESAFATSYIPTSGSTATRADDNAVISGTNFTDLYNESEGTIFSEFNTKATSGNVSKWVVSINDETTNNYIAMRAYNQTAIALNVKTSGSTVADVSKSNGVVSGQYIRSAGSFAANDFDGANGGELLTEDTTGGLPTGLTRMEIGRGWSSGQQLEGHIRFFKYYNKKLPNAQLQGLTQQ